MHKWDKIIKIDTRESISEIFICISKYFTPQMGILGVFEAIDRRNVE